MPGMTDQLSSRSIDSCIPEDVRTILEERFWHTVEENSTWRRSPLTEPWCRRPRSIRPASAITGSFTRVVAAGTLELADVARTADARHEPGTAVRSLVPADGKAPLCGAFSKPSDGLEPSTPSLPCAPTGNSSQPVATVLACLSRFRDLRICHRLPLVAPARLHQRSILSAQIRDEKTDLGALEPPPERVTTLT